MSATLVIGDFTGVGTDSGTAGPAMKLDFLNEEITVRELIERRVYEEVHDYNHVRPSPLQRLVSPAGAEAALNAPRSSTPASPGSCAQGRPGSATRCNPARIRMKQRLTPLLHPESTDPLLHFGVCQVLDESDCRRTLGRRVLARIHRIGAVDVV